MRSKRGTMQVIVVEKVECGTEGGSRTRTSFRTTDFKSRDRATNLTKRYKPVFTRLAVVKVIASAGFVSTRSITILAPS